MVRAKVESRILRDAEQNAACPPRLVNELLNTEEVARFVRPETRGPQEPVIAPRAEGQSLFARTGTAGLWPLVAAMAFCVGVIVGKIA